MKIKKSFVQIALAAGLVGIAACSGSGSSDTTVLRQQNAALATNVQKLVGIASSENYEDSATDYTNASFRKGDSYQFSFDVNLDAVDENENSPTSDAFCSVQTDEGVVQKKGLDCDGAKYVNYRRSLQADFRNAFSNFSLSGSPDNAGTENLSKIRWAKCPLVTEFEPVYEQYTGDELAFRERAKVPTNEVDAFEFTFVEAPDDSFVDADCNPIPADTQRFGRRVLYGPNGEAVEATGAIFTIRLRGIVKKYGALPLFSLPSTISQPTLKEILPTGLDGLVANTELTAVIILEGSESRTDSWNTEEGELETFTYKLAYTFGRILSLSSSKVLDYAPFNLSVATYPSGIKAAWKRSADLEPNDAVTHVLEWSTDGFQNQIDALWTADENMFLPSCSINGNNSISVGTDISFRVHALDEYGIPSASTNVATVKKTTENIVCPGAALAAPTDVKAILSIANYGYTVSWTAPTDAGASTILYCLEASGDAFATEENTISMCDISDTTVNFFIIFGWSTTSFRVIASRDTGAVSPPSDSVDVMTPETQPVTSAKAKLSGDDIKVSWVNRQIPDLYKDRAWISWGLEGATERGPQSGSAYVQGQNSFVIVVSELGEQFIPGTSVWINIEACAQFGCSETTSITYTYPVPAPEVEVTTTVAPTTTTTTTVAPTPTRAPVATTTVAPTTTTTTTLAPAVEASAKTAIIDPAVTEVQLPSNSNVAIVVSATEVVKGFEVPASEVKTVEYQVAKGPWVALAGDSSVKIPETATDLAVRVTTKDGKNVVSEKKIVRTGVISVKAGATTTKSKLLSLANLASPSGSKYALTVASASKSICKVSGTGIKALKKGTCTVKVSVTPAGKKATSQSVKITVK